MGQVKYSSLCLLRIHHNMWWVFFLIYKISPCHDNYYKKWSFVCVEVLLQLCSILHLAQSIELIGMLVESSLDSSASLSMVDLNCDLRILYAWSSTYSLVTFSSRLRKVPFILVHTLWMSTIVVHLAVALSSLWPFSASLSPEAASWCSQRF